MHDLTDVKTTANNRWIDILTSLTSIDSQILDGANHPCPKCGGSDRFRMIDKAAGALLCNQCFNSKNGDGIAAVQWLLDCDFKTALSKIGDHLGLKQRPKKSTALINTGKREIDPAGCLKFITWNKQLANLWCLKKKPITEAALLKLGAKQAIYSYHFENFKVIAIPTTQPGSEHPVGWTLYNITGGTLPRKVGKKTDQVKVKLTYGSKSGIIGRIDPDSTVVWKTEGPTDLLALLSLDLPAGVSVFCNANGAKEDPHKNFNWLPELLKGKESFVVHDCDEPGQQGATTIPQNDGSERIGWAPFLATGGSVVRNVLLPYPIAPTKGKDLRDWIAENGSNDTYNELKKLADNSALIQPVEAQDITELLEHDDDPHRLARVNLAQYKREHDGRLVFWRDEWWKYKKGCYTKIEPNELRAKLTAAIRRDFERCFREHQLNTPDPDDLKPIKRVTRGLVTNVIGAIESMTTQSASVQMPSWLPDRSTPNYLSMKNGILDITKSFGEQTDLDEEEGELLPHSPNWFSSFQLDYEYDKNAKSQAWLDYIEFITEGDQEKTNLLQEWAGYLLWPNSERQSFLVFEGEGGTGKSSFFAGMAAMVGESNVSSLSLEDLGDSFGLASTVGKVANIAGDVGTINGNEEAILKRYTGGDKVEIQRKFLPSLSLRPQAKMMMAWNTRPRFRDKSGGLWRRMILIPLNNQVGTKRVFGMDNPKFWQPEAPGIMAWALEGLKRLVQQNGFSHCQARVDAIAEFRDEVNPIREFLTEFIEPNEQGSIESRSIYQIYQHWCRENGRNALSDRAFGKQVRNIFPNVDRKKFRNGRKLFWRYEKISFSVDEICGKQIFSGDAF